MTIDGHASVRRLYRGFTDPDSAMAFVNGDPGESYRLFDRRTAEPVLARLRGLVMAR